MGVPTPVLALEFISCLEYPKSQIFSKGRVPSWPSRSSSMFSSFRSRLATPCRARLYLSGPLARLRTPPHGGVPVQTTCTRQAQAAARKLWACGLGAGVRCGGRSPGL